MKISPESNAGRKLISLGVATRELEASSFLRFNWQAGAAITVALPFRRCLVLMKSKYLQLDEKGGLPVSHLLSLHRHELCHVSQVLRWGFFGYWRRQLWARLRTMSILAKESDAELPCYEAQRVAREELLKTHPPR